MSILVIAEHGDGALAAATRHAVGAAGRLGGDIHVLVAGAGCAAAAAAAARLAGVSRVLLAEAPHYADQGAENLAALVVTLAPAYGHLLFPATGFGKGVAPRLAALLDTAPVTDLVAIESADTFVRPIYAGNALATVRCAEPVKVLTVRAAAFAAAGDAATPAPVQAIAAGPDLGLARRIDRQISTSARPALAEARVVVAGGRGLASADNYRNLLEPLADRLGAALGASRAAVDGGFVGNDHQVGQTGQVVAPELYVAVGISGAAQHLAGMRDSKLIVAINKDPEAPIFQVADYGLVADLFVAVPALTEALGP